jgi:hypothetical protein
MSYITTVILTASILDDKETAIGSVDRWLHDNGKHVIVRIDDCLAAPKAPECCVWFGAFNFLDLPTFLDSVASAPWICPEDVRVFASDQENPFRQVFPAISES